MGYRDREKARIIPMRDSLFADAGGGLFSGSPREFVLADARLNLFEGARAGALAYFDRNKISWWKGTKSDGGDDGGDEENDGAGGLRVGKLAERLGQREGGAEDGAQPAFGRWLSFHDRQLPSEYPAHRRRL